MGPEAGLVRRRRSAQTIGSNAYFQNSAQVQCAPATPCTTAVGGGGTATVSQSRSVDMNAHTVGDEYATLKATTGVFNEFLPSASLPEGLRGGQLKITGNDPEAEGPDPAGARKLHPARSRESPTPGHVQAPVRRHQQKTTT